MKAFNFRFYSTSSFKFIPKSQPIAQTELEKLNEFISKSKRLCILSGAGLSTESGIPDYRSENVGLYATSKNRPVQYSDFIKSEEMRTRYWARNYIAWPTFSSFQPNKSHLILADWEHNGKVFHHVTQNVDSLLTKAGCVRLSELHGSAFRVSCLDCDFKINRHEMQNLIEKQNKNWSAISTQIAPDSDVHLTPEQIKGFSLPLCPKCSKNRLKPDIVFFGDNVAKELVNLINEKVTHSDALLLIGTTVHVSAK